MGIPKRVMLYFKCHQRRLNRINDNRIYKNIGWFVVRSLEENLNYINFF